MHKNLPLTYRSEKSTSTHSRITAMIRSVLILLGFTLLLSCSKKESLEITEKLSLCENEYNYYSGDEKIYLKYSLTNVLIEFKSDSLTKEEAEKFIANFPFLNPEIEIGETYKRLSLDLNVKCDCSELRKYLEILNRNDEIFSATPVFYTNENDSNSNLKILSEVLTKNNVDLISEQDFIEYAKSLNLELIRSKYGTQQFGIKEVRTGFESLEIANQIYESGKVEYSHPNFIVKFEAH